MGLWLKQDDGTLVSVGGMGMDDYVITGDPHNPPANWADQQLLYSDEHGLWMKRDGEIIQIAGHDGIDGTDGTDGTNGTNGTDGTNGKGWTSGHYDHENGTVTFESDDDLGFTTGDLHGADGADGKGWVSGEYLEGSGRVQFTSNDGLGFQTLDLRGADGADGADGDVEEAPVDAKTYGRKSNDWVHIPTVGVGVGDPPAEGINGDIWIEVE